MYSLTSGTYLIHNSPSLACVSSPLAHTYFIFFLFSHVFSYLWHILISSFFSFRMYSPTSGTYPIHNFTLSRTCFLASGTYLFHLFSLFACIRSPLTHTYSIIFLSLACVSLPLAHTYFIFFLFSHVFPCLRHIPISSFFSFRMCSLASGTYLFHNFNLSRMYSLASGTYLIHNFTLSRMYFSHHCSYVSYACIISTNRPLKK